MSTSVTKKKKIHLDIGMRVQVLEGKKMIAELGIWGISGNKKNSMKTLQLRKLGSNFVDYWFVYAPHRNLRKRGWRMVLNNPLTEEDCHSKQIYTIKPIKEYVPDETSDLPF